ncbi:NmrA/HSCARG family protein [Algoriphagus aestuariicola]|uniref:NmrA/HSCARG family protein n=1 Tax=Algoriphagus aestuariicola TaxID=1852016 RepID=A0ABS3BL78_9BACT|nr:NmrA/HSCARG family protein [Algoriphagus aestuariicola]MBN7799696.1 NmrA/HSCARG family protein [Algoriphagus aestuariicola]
MSEKKIITVFGATGAQGGGLARAILNDPGSDFSVRAVTRDKTSEKAKALEKLGAEVVEADLAHPATVRAAMEGAYGAFCVTFFWDHFSPEKEADEANCMAEAANAAGVQHVIWSTLEDTRLLVPLHDDTMPTLMGKYKVPHFDAKGESNKFFIEAGVPTTFLLTTFYWENLIYFGMGPKRGEDGVLAITFPMGGNKLSGIAAEDIGKCAYGIFKKGKEMVGKTVGIAGEHITCEDMAKALTKALGEEVRYNAIPAEVFRSFGFPGAEDLGNMFQYYEVFEKEFTDARDIAAAKELNPDLQSFEEWLKKNAKRIPIE